MEKPKNVDSVDSVETPVQNQNNEELVDVEFDNADNTVVANTESQTHYTTIDHLDEDAPIEGQRFVLISFISPEGVMNCNVRGIKVRGVFGDEEEARKAAARLQSKDKYFHVFVGEIGKWLPWDPDPNLIKESNYANRKLDKLMKTQQEKQMNQLNELVGRKKDIIDNDNKAHKKRVAESMKNNSVTPSQDITEQPRREATKPIQQEQVPKKRNNHDPQALREKLRKLHQSRQQAREATKLDTDNKIRDELLKREAERLKQNNNVANETKDKISNINSNIAKMQEYLNKRRANKSENKA